MKNVLEILRLANVLRLPRFKNKQGGKAHSRDDGSDWRLSGWANAVSGELGELANLIKKLERGDFGEFDPDYYYADELPAEFTNAAAGEIADVLTYLDILAYRMNLVLWEVTKNKYNEVSTRVKSGVFITHDNAITLDGTRFSESRLDMLAQRMAFIRSFGD